MKVRPRQAADLEAARAFLARHHHTSGARLGQLFNQGNFVPVIGSPANSSLNNVRWDFGSVPA
jgi:hypothetical protein